MQMLDYMWYRSCQPVGTSCPVHKIVLAIFRPSFEPFRITWHHIMHAHVERNIRESHRNCSAGLRKNVAWHTLLIRTSWRATEMNRDRGNDRYRGKRMRKECIGKWACEVLHRKSSVYFFFLMVGGTAFGVRKEKPTLRDVCINEECRAVFLLRPAVWLWLLSHMFRSIFACIRLGGV